MRLLNTARPGSVPLAERRPHVEVTVARDRREVERRVHDADDLELDVGTFGLVGPLREQLFLGEDVHRDPVADPEAGELPVGFRRGDHHLVGRVAVAGPGLR